MTNQNKKPNNFKIPQVQKAETKISNQVQAIQHFIEKMDIEMLEAFLDNDKTYQKFEKYLYISKLQQAFSTFADLGDTHLIAFEGRCNGCDKTQKGYTFKGNKSNNYMNIIFDATENKINDLYECREFKANQTNLNLNERIYIDKDYLPI